ncbi:SUT5 [Symbiodinium natans]|uniref:SUT5 protein n=1 Tax=Symbiodinium natans TaxID=878477 RepID=A0A812JC38_9DINO|nr:SUT5 [Symbiodinium natans]
MGLTKAQNGVRRVIYGCRVLCGYAIADVGDDSSDTEEKEFYPLWKLTLIAIPQLGVQVMWCFIGPNAACLCTVFVFDNTFALKSF